MLRPILFASALALSAAAPLAAQTAQPPATGGEAITYADLVTLADEAPLVVRAQIRDQVALEPERAPGLAPGHARLYIEARTTALIAGNAPLGEGLRYLVDVPYDAKGKLPKLKKADVILFARSVPNRPGELQLLEPDAQLRYTPELEQRLRPILSELVAADAPPVVTGVGDALAVQGTLVGESETQLFLDTENDGPVSITIVRRPNQEPRWGVSWTEIVDQSARAPQRDTLAWYRLACTLPPELPTESNLTRDPESRALAARDYAYLIEQLGPCVRTRG